MDIDPRQIQSLVRIATQQTGRPLHDEDLNQYATLKAVQAFRKRFDVKHPRALLRKIVRDAVRDHWRRRKTAEDLDALGEQHFSESPCFEERLDRERRLDLLRRAMSQLDAPKRRALELFYVEERSIAEIARLQAKSRSAVKMELLRARRLLVKIMKKLAERKPPPS